MEHKLEEEENNVDFGTEFRSNAEGEKTDEFEDEVKPEKNPKPWWLFGDISPTSGKDLGTHIMSLQDRASFLSLWTYSFMDKILYLGANKVIEPSDIGVPSKQDKSERIYRRILPFYRKEMERCEKVNLDLRMKYEEKLATCKTDEEREEVREPLYKTPSLFEICLSFGKMRVIIAIVFAIAGSLLQFGPVVILNNLVAYVEHYSEFGSDVPYDHPADPKVQILFLFLFPVLAASFFMHGQMTCLHMAIYANSGLQSLLYQKSLKFSPVARGGTSTGQIVNMMSSDTLMIAGFFASCTNFFAAPCIVALAIYLIYQQVGSATWVGVAYMILLAPANAVVFKIVGDMRRKVVKFADTRIKMMSEILNGIRIVKFYAWEKPFFSQITQTRRKEMKALAILSYVATTGFSILLLSAPIVQPVLVFIAYVNISDQPLTAAKAFTTVALFNIMRFPFSFLPLGFLSYIQAKVGADRLSRALGLAELSPYIDSKPDPSLPLDSPYAQSGSISITNGNFTWGDPDATKEEATLQQGSSSAESNDEPSDANAFVSNSGDIEIFRNPTLVDSSYTLHNISCRFEPGSLVAVVGPVGSGKTSFLSAILGEMESVNGSKVHIPRTREEIGLNGFLSYCSQSPWVISETIRGNIVFGRPFDHRRYERVLDCCALRDDLAILPAGDLTEIGEKGINLSGGQKARVSLARSLYSRDTKVLLLDDPLSAVDAHVGEHLFEHAIDGPLGKGVTRVLVTHHVHVLSRCDKVLVMDGGRIKHQGTYRELVQNGVEFVGACETGQTKEKSGASEHDDSGEKNSSQPKEDVIHGEKAKEDGKKLIDAEGREEGRVKAETYMRYIRSGGSRLFLALILIQIIGRGFEVASTFWLAKWSDDMSSAEIAGDPLTDGEINFYVWIYGLLSFLGVVVLGVRGIILAKHRVKASNVIHQGVLKSVLRAPVAFFDVTPIGRILSRFAYDTSILDLEVSQAISVVLTVVTTFLGGAAGIVAATKGLFLVAIIPITYLYYVLLLWFLRTSTEVKRCKHMSHSPIFADFSQMLTGIATIRAYGVQGEFFEKFRASLDHATACTEWMFFVDYWLVLRLDVIGGFLSCIIAIFVLATLPYDFVPAGYFGLSLSFSIELTIILKFGVQVMAMLESHMSSVDRIFEYTDKIEPEAPDVIEGVDPEPGTWPKDGNITLSNISMRYRNGPLVLKGLDLKIKGGEKIGVCGRTGSGKSSLMIALFRICEIEDDGGSIRIDNYNTREIGTDSLRRNLAIIPQDPVIFSTTVRFNLDPFNTKTDDELWNILKKVRLAEIVAKMPDGLDAQIPEGGDNFSLGQKQLLCIARAVALQPKILIMDEATASIDNETDAAMQVMIRENFKSATVLTIAHRLNTIMDSDRILVLDQGQLAELDTPQTLMSRKASIFKSMVETSQEGK